MIAETVSWLLGKRSLKLLLFALGLALIPAIFSVGFHHPDEQFSILELMNYKLGNVGPGIFNWDFHLKIRPFFQVAVYTVLYHVLAVFNLDNPFWVASFIRYFNLAFGVYAIYFLVHSRNFNLKEIEKKKAFLIVLATWFVPYILVRTSSESFSISLALLGIGLFGDNKNLLKMTLAGLFMGLSFATRFQMGIVAFSMFLWIAIFHYKTHLKEICLFCFGVIVGAALLAPFDYWGYEEWVFSPWNYLRENLLEGKVNSFGVKPIWYFFTKGIVKGAVFPALLCLAGTIAFLKKNLKSVWPWVIIPYLIIHSVIGHKEIRFLNFLYVLTPLLTFLIWKDWKFKGKKAFLIIAVVINIICLIRVLFFPVYKPLEIYKTIYSSIPVEKNLYTIKPTSGVALELQMRFYVKNGQRLKPVPLDSLRRMAEGYFLVTSRYDEREIAEDLSCKEVDSIYPGWIYNFNYFNWLKRSSIWSLWYCQAKKKEH